MVSAFIGTLEFAKVLMTVFVMIYAYFFLRNAEDYEERRPWLYLFAASMFLFVVEVLATLQLFQGGLFNDQYFADLQQFLEFCFLTFFLFSFIYQHHLLLKRGVLVIEEKESKAAERAKGVPLGLWEKFKQEYLMLEEKAEKALDKEEGEDPEEELKEEFEELEKDDQELKKEEEDIEKLVKDND